jgi:endonuclease/exonuclease/phosphatase family metal-dependent hydrolase
VSNPSRIKIAVSIGVAFVVTILASPLGEGGNHAIIRCTTWNLEWFPNGSAHDASPEEQNRRITDAATVLKPLHSDILLLQEVRDYDACSRLGNAIEPGTYHVEICSAFKGPFRSGLGKQQVAILSRLQAQVAWSEQWKSVQGIDPPRGFAFAWFKIRDADIGVYSVHLKSNLIIRGNKEAEAAKNIRKREVAIDQLMAHIRDFIGAKIPTINRFIIGGDFNTNQDQRMFASEKTLNFLGDAGFQNSFEGFPLSQRVTHPANHGYPDATFDYLFGKNFKTGRPFATPTEVSDHWPVTCDFEIE